MGVRECSLPQYRKNESYYFWVTIQHITGCKTAGHWGARWRLRTFRRYGNQPRCLMDSKVMWKSQVDAITRKVNRALYGLKSFWSCTTEALRKQLASALVVPHLDYCSLVYLDVTNDLQTRLGRLQNSCVRYICGARKYEHITPYRRKLGWLKLWVRREYYAAILIYKIICMKQPLRTPKFQNHVLILA